MAGKPRRLYEDVKQIIHIIGRFVEYNQAAILTDFLPFPQGFPLPYYTVAKTPYSLHSPGFVNSV